MKKNILFVMPSLSAGGGEKSLVNLLSQLDYNKYNVDLFLFNHEGIFMEFVPKEVNIVPLSEDYLIFTLPLMKSLKQFFLKGKLSLVYNRMMYSIFNRRGSKNTSVREQRSWKYLSKSLEKLNRKYDTAVGFLEKSATYFTVEKVDSDNKIGWIHIDYDQMGMDPNFDLNYFRQLNKLVTVSEECAKVLKNRFPCQSNKVEIVYNIVSPKMIRNMAEQNLQHSSDKRDNEISIISIGRLHYQKAFELAIESCKILVDKGYKINWNVIGEGPERNHLETLIKMYRLEKNFRLLGLKSNPYPYIKQADIYVQTSKFEGKSIAIDEAKILNKPIVVTNYSTAKDQIKDGVNGLIVEMNSKAISSGIEKLINNSPLRERFTQHLSVENLGTEDEIKKLYYVI
jgi:glycosyltransferase involved in cell wall biosynthesis